MTHYQPINSESTRKQREEDEEKRKHQWNPDEVDPTVDVMQVTRQLSEGMR